MARLIRPDDFYRLAGVLQNAGIAAIADKIFRPRRKKIQSAWEHVESDRSSWWDLEEVVRRWNRLITGDPALDYQPYVARKYLLGVRGLKAVSIGCGTGSKEVKWAATKKFSTIDGYDISPSRIQCARELRAESKWKDRLDFQIGDVHTLQFAPASFDVVIFDNSLHHCSPLGPVVHRVHRWLKEDGLLVLNEYVGPDRFQWTDEQTEITNSLLRLLPERFRMMKDGRLKTRMTRFGSLAIRMNDPSEAAESSSMLRLVQEWFKISELKPYGGTILANLLKDIAHNFRSGEAGARDWLPILFEIEDRLMNEKVIPSDYVFAVLKKLEANRE